jgi:hypothetical protein
LPFDTYICIRLCVLTSPLIQYPLFMDGIGCS